MNLVIHVYIYVYYICKYMHMYISRENTHIQKYIAYCPPVHIAIAVACRHSILRARTRPLRAA